MSDTPMMRQYRDLKEQHPEEILFFRLGDFYEMFHEDAREASQILNLTLTARNGVPMCGIPYHAAKNYIRRLLDAGKKIAVCEQTRLPEEGRGLAEREVVQIVTPGSVVDEDLLEASDNNYILAVACRTGAVSVSYADLSTGAFCSAMLERDSNYESLRRIIARIDPVELLIQESVYFEDDQFRRVTDQNQALVTRFPDWYFDISDAQRILQTHFASATLKQFGIEDRDPVLASAGVLFSYLQNTSRQALSHIREIRKISDTSQLLIDESSQKNLELVRNMHDNSERFTLYAAIRDTRTSAGARLLRSWILAPLARRDEIEHRRSFVDLFYRNQELHGQVRNELAQTLDLERLCSRLSLNRAAPKDLLSVRITIDRLFAISGMHPLLGDSFRLVLSDQDLLNLNELSALIDRSINEDVNGPFSEGEVIRNGYSSELDELRSMKDHRSQILDEYARRLIDETGIPKMRISFNRIIGYYIEVSKTHASKVPAAFIRKQTLVNGERYTTEELIEIERKLAAAQQEAEALERNLYHDILEAAIALTGPLLASGGWSAVIDCCQSFARTAIRCGYTRPVLTEDDRLIIINGRHPVVEAHLPPGEFVPNSLELSPERGRFSLITGPNMSGKSTFLRQTALIVLMAHMGSYIPADSAAVPLHDKLFCRVGASDNLARGESTFLVEMTETAYILRSATPRSLVIMDEVGRGTSTQDGVAIAFGVMKRLLSMGCETLFATHYHELTVYEDSRIQHLYLEVSEVEGSIIFRNKIRPGNAPSSYGLHAARLAGIPQSVLRIAESYQHVHKKHEIEDVDALQHDLDQLFAEESSQPVAGMNEAEIIRMEQCLRIIEQLKKLDVDACSPREALDLLYQIVQEARSCLPH